MNAETTVEMQAPAQAVAHGPFFVETLARNGDVLHRHQLDRLPIRLGRGYDNDYIVDDAYSAARHAVIEDDGKGGLLLRGLTALFTAWLSDFQPFVLIRYLQALAYGIGASLVWCGAWAFANRLFGRHARLGRHLFIFGCGVAVITVFKLLSSLLAYAFSLEFITRYGTHVLVAIGAVMLFYHLCTVKPNGRRRFAITCVLLGVLGSGLTLISNEQRTGRLGDELYMSVLLPPATRVARDHQVDEFMGEVGAMRATLDAERARKVKDAAAAADDDDDD